MPVAQPYTFTQTRHALTPIECQDCLAPFVLPPLQPGQTARCPHCSAHITTLRDRAFDRARAFALTALVFLFLALCFDFLAINAGGQNRSISLIQNFRVLNEQGYALLACIQVATLIAIPAAVLCGLLYLLTFRHPETLPTTTARVFRWTFHLLPWAMAEIFLISLLVSLIKLSAQAELSLGLAFYHYLVFSLCFIASVMFVDRHQLAITLFPAQTHEKLKEGSPLSERDKSLSIQRTWALIITAALLYIPANLLPIMHTQLPGDSRSNTIIGGIIRLWESGSYPVAIIIFIASVFVPLIKLLILAWLNYTVQTGKPGLLKERLLSYRFIEFIGRWSMVDVFVVAILAGLVQLGSLMNVTPGPAILVFFAVVVVTIFATNSFKPQLIPLTAQGAL